MKFLTPEQMEKPRKRRLRKKLRLGEFQEFGFSFELTYDRNALSHDDALDHLIDFVEAQGCVRRWRLAGTGGDQRLPVPGAGRQPGRGGPGKRPSVAGSPTLVQDLRGRPVERLLAQLLRVKPAPA